MYVHVINKVKFGEIEDNFKNYLKISETIFTFKKNDPFPRILLLYLFVPFMNHGKNLGFILMLKIRNRNGGVE